MLLGILGPHATGKTTYCTKLMQEHRDGNAPSLFPLKVVLADTSRILLPSSADVNADWTKAKQDEKKQHLDDIVANDAEMYIIESARFFGGIMPYVAELHAKYRGGVRFILASVTYEKMMENIGRRCAKKNKVFNREFWADRAQYENRTRYMNQLTKQAPLIHYTEFCIDDYSDWDIVHAEVLHILQLGYGDWYAD